MTNCSPVFALKYPCSLFLLIKLNARQRTSYLVLPFTFWGSPSLDNLSDMRDVNPKVSSSGGKFKSVPIGVSSNTMLFHIAWTASFNWQCCTEELRRAFGRKSIVWFPIKSIIITLQLDLFSSKWHQRRMTLYLGWRFRAHSPKLIVRTSFVNAGDQHIRVPQQCALLLQRNRVLAGRHLQIFNQISRPYFRRGRFDCRGR